MSLINDALKKAGQQVELQNAGKPSAGYSMAPSHPPHRVRRQIVTVVLATLTIAAVLAGLFFFRAADEAPPGQLAVRRESTRPAVATGSRDSTPAAVPAAQTAPEPAIEEPSDSLALPESEEPTPSVTGERPRASVAEPTAPTPKTPLPAPRSAGNGLRATQSFERLPRIQDPSDGAERAASPRLTTASPPPAKAQTASEPNLDGQSFLKRVRLPGGGTIVLSGIAWSTVSPVAVISGSVVSPGERVKGYTVTRIQQNSVELSNDGSTFTIRLR